MKQDKAVKPVSDELIDQWLKEGRKPEDVNGLLKQITKAVLERAMQTELTEHLGYEKHDPAGDNSSTSRNGVSRKRCQRAAKSSAEMLQDEAKAAGIDRAFEANPDSAEFDVDRARVRPDESVCFVGDLRDAHRVTVATMPIRLRACRCGAVCARGRPGWR